jgi:parallel beta-helix repeat protein
MFNYESAPTVTNCDFVNNTGGMYSAGGSPTVTNCTFTDNHAVPWEKIYGGIRYSYLAVGGGMYNDGAAAVVMNCTFTNNTAEIGGGIAIGTSSVITNCIFRGNSALYGGGMYNTMGAPPIIINSTFTNNSATYEGGGMYNEGALPSITNCIFWNDTSGAADREHFDHATVDYCIVQGGYSWNGTVGGNNNIGSDPLFVDAANGDLRLTAGSPAIDAGGCGGLGRRLGAKYLAADDLVDHLGNPRWNIDNVADAPDGNGMDIGAYEYQGTEGTDTILTDLGCQ